MKMAIAKKKNFSGEMQFRREFKPDAIDKAIKMAKKEATKKDRETLLLEIRLMNDGRFSYYAPRTANPIRITDAIMEYLRDDFCEYKTRESAQMAMNDMFNQIADYVDEVMGDVDDEKFQNTVKERSKRLIYKVWKEQCDAELPRASEVIQEGEDYIEIAKEHSVAPHIMLWALDEATLKLQEEYRKLKDENTAMKVALEQDKDYKDSQIEALKVTNSKLNKEIAKLDHRLKEMEMGGQFGGAEWEDCQK